MTTATVQLRSVKETGAALGFAGPFSIVVDRPAGRAGGTGLGLNGGQLLALAIGGCLCNDLHYVAHEMDIELDWVAIDVTVAFAGEPLLATDAKIEVAATAKTVGADIDAVIARAEATSTVANSIARAIRVQVVRR